ncbi:hypothetical protein [Tabrizicola oligotrophica]|uniref:Uncharacterized protein n=1 Tax=Tabrizicola oligotrophica TaxID=2710650 RepID=A0A6M0QUV2_9RHOB|nr:hypothetical protein [Tabrizicola oligotrophica]NEY91268.1 hypothetical protein [Tabrizicola oligotrophica]
MTLAPRALALLLALACPLSPAFAEEACLTAETLKSGVAVTVEGGAVQVYRAKGRDVLASIPVPAGGNGFSAELVLARGLHVVSDHRTEHEGASDLAEGEVLVGGNDGGTTTTLYAYPNLPKPGKDWAGRLRLSRDQDGPSIGPQPRIKGTVAAQVRYLAEATVTISGCAYRIQPVETVLTVKEDSRFTLDGAPQPGIAGAADEMLLTRRQIWFPDLGFAVITRESGLDAGWSEAWGQGIIGLAAN